MISSWPNGDKILINHKQHCLHWTRIISDHITVQAIHNILILEHFNILSGALIPPLPLPSPLKYVHYDYVHTDAVHKFSSAMTIRKDRHN